MKEKALIKKITSMLKQGKDIQTGPGDDCAAIDLGLDKLLLVATDQVASGIHYDRDSTAPSLVAKKLLNRNLSDIAAMGGIPAYALLTVAANYSESEYLEFFESMATETEKRKVSLCGGDISSSPKECEISTLTIMGWVEKERICLRSGASPGDLLYTTGTFGNSFHSGHHLDFEPRLEQGRFLAGRFTNIMIDASDGLLADSLQIAEAANLGLIIETDKVQLREGASLKNALGEGEDYELIFAVPHDNASQLEEEWPFNDIPLSRIGLFTKEHPGLAYDSFNCNLSEKFKQGFDHFGRNKN